MGKNKKKVTNLFTCSLLFIFGLLILHTNTHTLNSFEVHFCFVSLFQLSLVGQQQQEKSFLIIYNFHIQNRIFFIICFVLVICLLQRNPGVNPFF